LISLNKIFSFGQINLMFPYFILFDPFINKMFNLVTSFSKLCHYLPLIKFTIRLLAKLFTSHFHALWPQSSSSQLNGKNACYLKKEEN